MTNTSSRTSNTITTEEWVRHFEGLLNPLITNEVNISDDDVSVDESIDEIEDYIFNSDIAEDEIRLSVKHLKFQNFLCIVVRHWCLY